LREYVESDLETLHRRNVRVRILGSRKGLTSDLLSLINRVEETTQENTDFYLNIAFNYGGRDEVLRALAKAAAAGYDFEDMTEAEFGQFLDTAGLPEVDLVIRTSGEKRISNFLLWQSAYAEFVFTDVLWPDYSVGDLQAAISEFNLRTRRFGNLDTAEVA
jgi:undecaprenyl diphosphate synthase